MSGIKKTNGVKKKKSLSKANGKKDDSGFVFKEWYEDNRKELSARRRDKYRLDNEYRQKILEKNKAYRKKRIDEELVFSKPKIRIPKHRKVVSLPVKIGRKVVISQLVYIGAFARAIGRSVPAIHQWERIGLLPRTPYCTNGESKHERLYTADMIRVVQEALSRRGTSMSSKDPTFYKEVVAGWKSMGSAAKEE